MPCLLHRRGLHPTHRRPSGSCFLPDDSRVSSQDRRLHRRSRGFRYSHPKTYRGLHRFLRFLHSYHTTWLTSSGVNAKAFALQSSWLKSGSIAGPLCIVHNTSLPASFGKITSVMASVYWKGAGRITTGCGGRPSPREWRVLSSSERFSWPILGPWRRVTAQSDVIVISCTPALPLKALNASLIAITFISFRCERKC